ncbi:hypothetical protein L9F63_019947 [Diploptera punctata]|uniref:Uncharacterized protein n=1 Tax=Diploptera punctata TaxID=6984 RepID=A0AAD8EDD7_DIPPU|nr:hypothetical protein L9F63_019947 [Diploptera punctata]
MIYTEDQTQMEEARKFGYPDILNHLLKYISKQSDWPIHVTNTNEEKETFLYDSIYKSDCYIIFSLPDLEVLQEQMWDLVESAFWSNRAKFLLVIVGDHFEEPFQEVQTIIDRLWKYYKILDIVILIKIIGKDSIKTIQNRSMVRFDLYSWRPYQSNFQCADTKNILIEDTWNIDVGQFLKQTPLYTYQMPNQYHGCPLRVTAMELKPFLISHNNTERIEFSGYDQRIVHLVAQKMNMRIEYLETRPGNRIEIRMNALEDLLTGITDVICGGYVIHPAITPFADPTVSYTKNSVKWCVPCGTPIPRVKKISQIFKSDVWLMMGLQFILSVFAISWISDKMSRLREEEKTINIGSSVCTVLSIMIGVSIPKMPVSSAQRIIFIILIWYSFALSTVFQSLFTSILINPGVSNQIRLLEELIKSNLDYYYVQGSDEFMNFTSPTYYGQVKLKRN